MRYDDFNIFDEGLIGPRVALVYKLNDKNTFRASFNRSTSGPVALQQFIDFPLAILEPGVLDVWLAGQADPHLFSDNAYIDLALTDTEDTMLSADATGLPAAFLYGAIAGQPGAIQGLGGLLGQTLGATAGANPLAGAQAFGAWAQSPATVGGLFTQNLGMFYKYNLFTGESMMNPDGSAMLTDVPGSNHPLQTILK